jgi:hypothetical protein
MRRENMATSPLSGASRFSKHRILQTNFRPHGDKTPDGFFATVFAGQIWLWLPNYM